MKNTTAETEAKMPEMAAAVEELVNAMSNHPSGYSWTYEQLQAAKQFGTVDTRFPSAPATAGTVTTATAAAKKFINISNHPSTRWGTEQIEAAQKFGDIYDVEFPNVPATAGTEKISQMADELLQQLLERNPATVMTIMVAGEFTLAYAIITRCLRAGITVVAACSDRCTEEVVNSDGTTTKTVTFKFVQFREFPKL